MSVELIDKLGSDLTIVNAARVSYGKVKTKLDPGDDNLIGYLMRERHGTPFEHVVFQFRVKCSIGVAREWFRHRIGSFNEISTRYVEMAPSFVSPRPRKLEGKQSRYQYSSTTSLTTLLSKSMLFIGQWTSWAMYQGMLKLGVAREVARYVLPLSLNTEFIWTVNLRSLMNFVSLRTAPNAVEEIREEAWKVHEAAWKVCPVAMKHFEANGWKAP